MLSVTANKYYFLCRIHYLSSGTDKQMSAGIVMVVVLTDANQIQGRNQENKMAKVMFALAIKKY